MVSDECNPPIFGQKAQTLRVEKKTLEEARYSNYRQHYGIESGNV